jgi:hypothetical protein
VQMVGGILSWVFEIVHLRLTLPLAHLLFLGL